MLHACSVYAILLVENMEVLEHRAFDTSCRNKLIKTIFQHVFCIIFSYIKAAFDIIDWWLATVLSYALSSSCDYHSQAMTHVLQHVVKIKALMLRPS